MNNGKQKWEQISDSVFKKFVQCFKNTWIIFFIITIQVVIVEILILYFRFNDSLVNTGVRYGVVLSAIFYTFAFVACRSYYVRRYTKESHQDSVSIEKKAMYRKRAVYNFFAAIGVYAFVVMVLIMIVNSFK